MNRRKRGSLCFALAALISSVDVDRQLSSFPLNALRAFEAASRLGSFKAAANELAVTPAAISHQVGALEQHLGAALFDRLHRSLRLTDAGAQLAATVQQAFANIRNTLAELSADGLVAGPTTLCVSAAPSFATKWLAPRLHRFQETHPHIEFRLLADNALVDLARDLRVDVALRYGAEPREDNLHAEALWRSGEIFPVCAPSAPAANLSDPSALLEQTLLRTAAPSGPSGSGRIDWAAWFAAAGVSDSIAIRAAARGPLFGNTQLALEAAIGGQGVALAPALLVEDDVRTGRLIKPFDLAVTDPFSYWLIYRRDRADEARIRTFADWLRREAVAGQASTGNPSR